MHVRLQATMGHILLLGLFLCCLSGAKQSSGQDSQVKKLIDHGDYAAAERLLRGQISDPAAPVTSEPAIQLEILRRARYDFALTNKEVLAEIKQSIPDATQADVDHWRKAGDLQYRVIDGDVHYFRRSVSNLFRFNAEARRRQRNPSTVKKFNLVGLVEKIVRLSDSSQSPEVYPVKHHVRYEVMIRSNHPRLKPGAVVRAWLPFPQEYRQQKDVKLVRSQPPAAQVTSSKAAQRSVYFEQIVANPQIPPRFEAEFEFVTSAYCQKLDPTKVKPYDLDSAVYREYTAERAAAHCLHAGSEGAGPQDRRQRNQSA